jgi:hypothetical protein
MGPDCAAALCKLLDKLCPSTHHLELNTPCGATDLLAELQRTALTITHATLHICFQGTRNYCSISCLQHLTHLTLVIRSDYAPLGPMFREQLPSMQSVCIRRSADGPSEYHAWGNGEDADDISTICTIDSIARSCPQLVRLALDAGGGYLELEGGERLVGEGAVVWPMLQHLQLDNWAAPMSVDSLLALQLQHAPQLHVPQHLAVAVQWCSAP